MRVCEGVCMYKNKSGKYFCFILVDCWKCLKWFMYCTYGEKTRKGNKEYE